MGRYGPIQGPGGIAVPMTIPDLPQCAPVMGHWLVTTVGCHPERTQYIAALMSLADFPGMKTPARSFPEATHEIAILPLDPRAAPQTARSAVNGLAAGTLAWVQGDEIYCQVRAEHEDAAELLPVLVFAIVCQGWNPDISPDPGQLRASWQAAIVRNLVNIAHDRLTAVMTQPMPVVIPPP